MQINRSMHLYLFYVLFLELTFFCSFCPVLVCSLLLSLTFYFIYPLEARLLSNERQKGGRSEWERRCRGAEKSGVRENCNQNILCAKINLFSIK